MRSRMLTLALLLLTGGTPPLAATVDAKLAEAAAQGPVEAMIRLHGEAPPKQAAGSRAFADRVAGKVAQLQVQAQRSQSAVLELLRSRDIEHRAFWVANAIWARLDNGTLDALTLHPDVRSIDSHPLLPSDIPRAELASMKSVLVVEWGVERVNAPTLWKLGFFGQGVVIGGQDTGYQWDHPALRDRYRGWNGTTADHNHHWHDAVHALIGDGTNPCGVDAPAPCDDNNHGTHTMGTMVGDDGASNQIGVAPQARWIGCRNMERGDGTLASYLECFQWFMAPTDLSGANANPALAPHIINNSWGCPASEGCSSIEVLEEAVDNARDAGILVVVAAGNSGSSCGTINTAPAPYASSFTVGAFGSANTIATFSSRGPVTVDGSQRLKPDIAAPGVSIRSSIRGNAYGNASGTSMAGPHVAGVAALLMSADPSLIGDPGRVEDLLRGSAIAATSAQDCAPFPGAQVPNAVFGHGRLDAAAAFMVLGPVFKNGFE